ncbi:glycosyltransferase, partial [Candidatus Bathyarchaeota archaeon]|nr:glycosyltransferase [Candidatus Bathyarchaeota archaeon]
LRTKGKYCVIFDAEDNPDEDQLKKAAVAFSHLPEDIVCLQSKLNFYNAKENLLSGWFSIEYSYWYDYYLQGLDRVDVPIPLGGTSNHFRVNQLRDLGGWDPYNVTEDADIGIRLSRRKLRTAMLDCYTYEEATIKLGSWIRQRSRWYKGHTQTYLVHMRHPIKLLQELGWRKFLLFQFTFGGGIYMPLINPFLWVITLVSFFAPWAFSSLFLLPIESICVFNLIVGNLSFLFLYLWTCVKQRRYHFVPLALTMPLYWMLISVAAWRGLWQLMTRPFYWEKTLHGVSKGTNEKP